MEVGAEVHVPIEVLPLEVGARRRMPGLTSILARLTDWAMHKQALVRLSGAGTRRRVSPDDGRTWTSSAYLRMASRSLADGLYESSASDPAVKTLRIMLWSIEVKTCRTRGHPLASGQVGSLSS